MADFSNTSVSLKGHILYDRMVSRSVKAVNDLIDSCHDQRLMRALLLLEPLRQRYNDVNLSDASQTFAISFVDSYSFGPLSFHTFLKTVCRNESIYSYSHGTSYPPKRRHSDDI